MPIHNPSMALTGKNEPWVSYRRRRVQCHAIQPLHQRLAGGCWTFWAGTAAAALNHANILAVHRFGTFEGARYLEGRQARQQLARGPLATESHGLCRFAAI
jgi:hypothetical protein